MIKNIVEKLIKSKHPQKDTTELHSLFQQPKSEKGNEVPKFSVYEKNYANQADILFLPDDNGYKYALVVVDDHTRACDAAPLRSKDADSVLKAIIKIYNRGILHIPRVLEIDSGSEFKSSFKMHFVDKGVKLHVGLPNRHRSQALVERKNQYIGTIIHQVQTQTELETGKINRKWVAILPEIIKELNQNLPKPKTTQSSDYPIISKSNKDLLAIGQKIRVILDYPQDTNGMKLHGKFRSTDQRFSREIYKVREVLLKPDYPPLYLTNEDNVARTRGQLQPLHQFV